MSGVTTCWSCQGPLTSGALFCDTCGAPSAHLSDNPFVVFGLSQSYALDKQALEKTYFALSRQLHPDRFAAKSPKALMLALQHTATLNAAYATLKDDLNRAIYLLRAQGVNAFDEAGQGSTPPALMATSFELHEALEDATTPQALQSMGQEVTTRVEYCQKRLTQAFAAGDVPAATLAALELKFLQTFRRDWQRKTKQMKDTA
ncbi:MAG: Fe-S protein assembly co-chaperone HscB [Proteobacteria bacterium]|nr:Fe-S protein assembly co-chaperone HscB [Pseudomonadota bacterium]